MNTIDEYREWMLGQGLSTKTISVRGDFASARLRQWGTWDLPPSTLAGYLSEFTGWSRLTFHAHFVSVYQWLIETGQAERNPMDAIKRPPHPASQPRPLNDEQVAAVFDGVCGDLRTWMLLAMLAGLRVHEVAKFRGEHIDAQRLTVLGKGGKLSTVPTHPTLWDAAQQYPRRGYWFPSPVHEGRALHTVGISAKVARRFRAVGIERGSIHRLRATYGTNLVRSGANLRVVQTLMRHSSLATTERYLGVDEDEREAAIFRLPGLLTA